ncbi:MAG: response regulator transcription factor [Pseudomonadota bacterium]
MVEDEPNAFARCEQIVASHPRLKLAASARNFADGCSLIANKAGDFDLLLTDLRLGDGDGAELIRQWRIAGGELAMVVTVFGDVESVLRAVEVGADGYVLKSGSDFEMMTAITTVLDGGAPISAAVAGHLLKKLRKQPEQAQPRDLKLSERELEILKDLAKGLSYKEVARERDISHFTVADHVKAIYRKLAVNSRGEAVYRAMKEGIISIESPPD